jgi:hypothetical protein
MASNIIYFENPHTGQTKEAPVGFSWTTLCFGCFTPLARGDWKWGIISGLLSVVTASISWMIFPFIYNKFYITDLVSGGFKVKSIKIGTIEQVSTMIGVNLQKLEVSK